MLTLVRRAAKIVPTILWCLLRRKSIALFLSVWSDHKWNGTTFGDGHILSTPLIQAGGACTEACRATGARTFRKHAKRQIPSTSSSVWQHCRRHQIEKPTADDRYGFFISPFILIYDILIFVSAWNILILAGANINSDNTVNNNKKHCTHKI